MPLTKKIALIFFLITLLASCLVGLIGYGVSKNLIMQSNIRNITNATAAVASSINNFFGAADGTVISVYSDQSLHQYLNCSAQDLPEKEDYYLPVATMIRSAKVLNDSVAFINVYGVNGFCYTDSAYLPEILKTYKSCVGYFREYGLDENKATALWVDNLQMITTASSQNLILNVRYIRNIYNYNIIGIMVTGIRESALYKQYFSVGKDSFILNDQGTYISGRNKQQLREPWEQASLLKTAVATQKQGTLVYQAAQTGQKTVAAYMRLHIMDWYFVNTDPYSEIFQNIYKLLNSILLILLLEAIAFFIIVRATSQKMTASVTRLFRVMQQVKQGDLNVRFQAGGGDEISRIGEDLNEMLSQIQEDLLYKERSEKIREISQLKLLQAQINPHLLYNTLDSVYYYLKTGDIGSAQSILNALSSFFKISLSKGEYYVPIRKEIEHIRCYLEIQRMCRDKDITLEVLSPAELLDCMIPKMTLQPIVENSILHGFEGEVSGGLIQIVLEKTEEVLTISLRDNGTGMLAGEVAELNDYLKNASPEAAPQSYGLWNVNQRIRHHFGGESGLSMESEFGEYTVVHIQMDLKKQQEEQKGTEL